MFDQRSPSAAMSKQEQDELFQESGMVNASALCCLVELSIYSVERHGWWHSVSARLPA
jgi:hypothetical protein